MAAGNAIERSHKNINEIRNIMIDENTFLISCFCKVQIFSQNCCENIFISIDGQSVMLQAVSIFVKPTEWTIEEMLPIMMNVSLTSLKIIGVNKVSATPSP